MTKHFWKVFAVISLLLLAVLLRYEFVKFVSGGELMPAKFIRFDRLTGKAQILFYEKQSS